MKRVLVIGSSFFQPGFALLAAGDIQVRFQDKDKSWNSLRLSQKIRLLKSCDVVHFFWARTALSGIILALLMRKEVIQHYIGSDVLLTLGSIRKIKIQSLLSSLGVKICAGSEQLRQELAEAGIKSKTLPFVNREIRESFTGYPQDQKVLGYVPDGKEDFYGLAAILACARKYPQIQFTILRNTTNFKLANVRSIPYVHWEDMNELYNNHSIYLRMTRHDSLSTAVVEALACARHVIWTQSFPHCIRAENEDELLAVMGDDSRFQQPNTEGQSYVIQNYSLQILREKYHALWKGDHSNQPEETG